MSQPQNLEQQRKIISALTKMEGGNGYLCLNLLITIEVANQVASGLGGRSLKFLVQCIVPTCRIRLIRLHSSALYNI